MFNLIVVRHIGVEPITPRFESLRSHLNIITVQRFSKAFQRERSNAVMKSCPNVHVYWSSHRVPVCNVLIDRVPVEFPITLFGNLISEHLPFYSCRKYQTNNERKGTQSKNYCNMFALKFKVTTTVQFKTTAAQYYFIQAKCNKTKH